MGMGRGKVEMIIISKVKMPNKCGECPCFHADHFMYCQAVKADKAKRIIAPYGEPRPEWCPLKEQKHGHWILDPDGMDWGIPAWCCSECHCRNDNIPPNIEKVNPLRWSGSKFCPNCGAQMER